MKVVQINGGVFGSTGKIMFSLARELERCGHQVLCAAPITTTNRFREPDHPYLKMGTFRSRQLCVFLDRITGLQGCSAVLTTALLLRRLRAFQPDVVHLQNLHGSFVNLPMLFHFLKTSGVRVIWTLHDCWSFTGHCPHYELCGCDRWLEHCGHCPQYRDYPKTYFDSSAVLHRLKRRWFTGLERMTLATPSDWLHGEVSKSFLRAYPVRTIHNGIDLQVFRPTESDFRERHQIRNDQILVLGVAFGWGMKKGLDVFVQLAEKLDDRYQIVLVGTDEAVDRQLPPGVITVHRTQDQTELAEIYSTADVFVNPSREDTFPTVNLEALACGTPVVTFRIGGCPETVDESCGAVVEKNDVDGLMYAMRDVVQNGRIHADACERFAAGFSAERFVHQYLELYQNAEVAALK